MFKHTIDDDIELRSIEEEDAEEYYDLNIRNRDRFYWLREIFSLEWARDFLKRSVREHLAGDRGFPVGIWVGGELVGHVSFNTIDRENHSTSLRFALDRSFEGRGLVSRACSILLNYAFEELDLNRVEIRCLAEGDKSERVARSLGFTREGILRNAKRVHDHFEDVIVYSILAVEWRNGEGSRPGWRMTSRD